jgi:hypothetical protein
MPSSFAIALNAVTRNLQIFVVSRVIKKMEVKLILVGLTAIFTVACLFFGTQNGFYDSDNYHGNGSAH